MSSQQRFYTGCDLQQPPVGIPAANQHQTHGKTFERQRQRNRRAVEQVGDARIAQDEAIELMECRMLRDGRKKRRSDGRRRQDERLVVAEGLFEESYRILPQPHHAHIVRGENASASLNADARSRIDPIQHRELQTAQRRADLDRREGADLVDLGDVIERSLNGSIPICKPPDRSRSMAFSNAASTSGSHRSNKRPRATTRRNVPEDAGRSRDGATSPEST
ncbi:hypothetical protein ABIA40_005013 [Bradyrhizobium sp. USDA 223]